MTTEEKRVTDLSTPAPRSIALSAQALFLAIAEEICAVKERVAQLEASRPQDEESVSKAEAARILGVSPRELDRLVREVAAVEKASFRPAENAQRRFVRRKVIAYRDSRIGT